MNSWLSGVLLSFVVGTAVQLQTPDLLVFSVYGAVLGFALLGVVVLGLLSLRNAPKPRLIGLGLVFLIAALGWSLTGVRAHLKLEQHIQPDLEGQNLRVTGVVAAMPQFHDAGVRFVFEVEQADFQGRPVAVPPKFCWVGMVARGPDRKFCRTFSPRQLPYRQVSVGNLRFVLKRRTVTSTLMVLTTSFGFGSRAYRLRVTSDLVHAIPRPDAWRPHGCILWSGRASRCAMRYLSADNKSAANKTAGVWWPHWWWATSGL